MLRQECIIAVFFLPLRKLDQMNAHDVTRYSIITIQLTFLNQKLFNAAHTYLGVRFKRSQVYSTTEWMDRAVPIAKCKSDDSYLPVKGESYYAERMWPR